MTERSTKVCIEQTKDWIQKVVLGLNFCPFAHQPYNQNLIRYMVVDPDRAVLGQIAEELDLLLAAPIEEVETSFVIIDEDIEFLPYLNLIGQIEQMISDAGYEGVIQVASFHPNYQFSDLSGDDVRNYTNRSPYAMVHFLREGSVTKAIIQHGKTDQIPIDNQKRLLELGKNGFDQFFKINNK